MILDSIWHFTPEFTEKQERFYRPKTGLPVTVFLVIAPHSRRNSESQNRGAIGREYPAVFRLEIGGIRIKQGYPPDF